jgi:hypothetical protein
LTLCIATTLNFNDQSSQDVSNRILFATSQEAPVSFDAASVCNQHPIIRSIAIANSESVGVAANYDALKLHFGAVRN